MRRAAHAGTAGRRPLTVLHVTESWGGGVSTAVADYISATPDCDHWLTAVGREGADPQIQFPPALRGVRPLPPGHRARIEAVRAAYEELRPDVVHAHSSYAGVYVRACKNIPSERIVFTPHCYGFERRDLSWAGRIAIRLIEARLARRTGVVAAVSPHEARLAVRLRRSQQVVYVPNIMPSLPADPAPGSRIPGLAVTVGRLSPQKDPEFLAAAAEAAGARSDRTQRWLWIGDGDPGARSRLTTAGVEVTGWLPRAEVLRLLGKASVYVHSARWEGATMSVLEAAGRRLPVIARNIPALRSMGLPVLVDTPDDLAAAVVRNLATTPAGGAERAANAERTRRALRECTGDVQAARLRHVYAFTSGLAHTLEPVHWMPQLEHQGPVRGTVN